MKSRVYARGCNGGVVALTTGSVEDDIEIVQDQKAAKGDIKTLGKKITDGVVLCVVDMENDNE